MKRSFVTEEGGHLPAVTADQMRQIAAEAEAIKKAADAYNRTRLTPTIHSLLRRWLTW